MRRLGQLGGLVLAILFVCSPGAAGSSESDIIRLKPRPRAGGAESAPAENVPPEQEVDSFGDARRGFDYQSFQARLEALWFQRKTLIGDGRLEDAQHQSQLIRAFCVEEGVKRLDTVAGALVSEARRRAKQGDPGALGALELAEDFDRDRAQVHLARSAVLWKTKGGVFKSFTELLRSLRLAVWRGLQDLTLFSQAALLFVVGLVACSFVFSLLMVYRYQVPLRHEVEEWMQQHAAPHWARLAGWTVLLMPFVLWFTAGWISLYWIVVTFRYMRRSERLAALALLLGGVLVLPAYRAAVMVYGMTADPIVRTTLTASDGEYAPDRVLKLQQLVETYPEDPVYRFLLGGMFKSGRYFGESYAAYRGALDRDPGMYEALINTGNVFHITGQYAEAVRYYRMALEKQPRNLLAYFNMHLTQSEAFKFKEADESLEQARAIDPEGLVDLFSTAGLRGERPTVLDASLNVGSLWIAAMSGRQPGEEGGALVSWWLVRPMVNATSLISLLALVACGVIGLTTAPQSVARRCIRCGRPFCQYCKSGREGHEYCSQCFHLYVLGDGLAPETKTRKLYEVERYERLSRQLRRLLSFLLPGSAQLLQGKALTGALLILMWLSALVAWQPALLNPVERLLGLDLRLDLVTPGTVPAVYALNAVGVLAPMVLLVCWIMGNAYRKSVSV